MRVYSTVVTHYYTGDSARFMRYGFDGFFSDGWQPAGYAAFLRATRAVSDWLPATVALQHLLGLALAACLYGSARALGLSKRLSVLPAAYVALSAEHLFLEQALITEAFWMFLVGSALVCLLQGARRESTGLVLLGSTLLGLSVVTRNVSLPLIPLFAIFGFAALGSAPGLLSRLRGAVNAAVPAALVVGSYFIVASAVGPYTGLGEMSGWSLYQRVGQFADCDQFEPPRGTDALCEERPPSQREGPFFYFWSPDAPARRAGFALNADEDEKVGSFARKAILAQPLDYLRTVAKDVVRLFDARAGADRVLSGSDPSTLRFQRSAADADYAAKVEDQYNGFDATPNRGTAIFESYSEIFRLSGTVLAAFVLLTALALVRTPRGERAGIALLAASAAVLMVLPPAVSSYDARYAIPPATILSVCAVLGLARSGLLTDKPRLSKPSAAA